MKWILSVLIVCSVAVAIQALGQRKKVVRGLSKGSVTCIPDPQPSREYMTAFISSEPPMKGFHRYRIRYKVHYANGECGPEWDGTVNAQSPEQAKEQIIRIERYGADGPNYRNIESSITISFEEPEILKD